MMLSVGKVFRGILISSSVGSRTDDSQKSFNYPWSILWGLLQECRKSKRPAHYYKTGLYVCSESYEVGRAIKLMHVGSLNIPQPDVSQTLLRCSQEMNA